METTIWNKYFKQEPMKYYDAAANINGIKAQTMLNNDNNNYIATLKRDGEWARIIVGEDGRIIVQSRNISKVTGEYGDKTELIPHIVENCKSLPVGTVLLGELCYDDITTTAKDVGTILRCKPAKAIERQKVKPLHFFAFDCLAYNGIDLGDKPYIDRFAALQELVEKTDRSYIHMCGYVMENFDEFLATILRSGGEGIVIHSKNYVYAPGKRPAWSTLKVKKTTGEIECPVIGFIDPKMLYEGTERDSWKYWEGWYKDNPADTYLVCEPCADDFRNTTMEWIPVTKPYFNGWKNGIKVYHNGNVVNVASGLTDDDRAWLATEEAINALNDGTLVAVISGMEITEDSIRHPRLIRLRTEA